MKISTKILIITIILILILGLFAYKNVKATGSVILIQDYETKDKGFDYNDYCEATEDTCLPADKCEFQTDSDGTKICLGKYK